MGQEDFQVPKVGVRCSVGAGIVIQFTQGRAGARIVGTLEAGRQQGNTFKIMKENDF